MKTNFQYRVYGNKIGEIWMPEVVSSKNFNEKFSRNPKEPFATYFETLRNIFTSLTNDGDFRSVSLNECYLDISYTLGNKTVTKTYDLRNSLLKDEFFTDEIEYVDFE